MSNSSGAPTGKQPPVLICDAVDRHVYNMTHFHSSMDVAIDAMITELEWFDRAFQSQPDEAGRIAVECAETMIKNCVDNREFVEQFITTIVGREAWDDGTVHRWAGEVLNVLEEDES